MKHFRLILSYLRPCRREFLLAVLFVTAETAFELFIPLVMANIIDLGVTRRDIPYILHQGLLMAVCALLSLTCSMPGTRPGRLWASAPASGRRNTKNFRNTPLPIWITLRPPP